MKRSWTREVHFRSYAHVDLLKIVKCCSCQGIHSETKLVGTSCFEVLLSVFLSIFCHLRQYKPCVLPRIVQEFHLKQFPCNQDSPRAFGNTFCFLLVVHQGSHSCCRKQQNTQWMLAWEDAVRICLCCIPRARGGHGFPSVPLPPGFWSGSHSPGKAMVRTAKFQSQPHQSEKAFVYEALLISSVCKVG